MTPSVGQFSPNPFKYNERFAVVLIPCLIVLSGLSGKVVSAILLAGAMFTYIMDTLRWKEASLGSIWITLISANFGFLISNYLQSNKSLLLMLGSSLVTGVTLLLVGLWATLQFKWMRKQDPVLILMTERCLFALSLPIGMVVFSLGLSTAVGIDLAPFIAMIMGCGLYYLFMTPLASSFQKISRAPGLSGTSFAPLQVQKQYEGSACALFICLFPSMLYLASHWEVAMESEHFSSIHLLWSAPAVFLCLLPDGVWWLPENIIRKEYSRGVGAVVCGIIALACFEERVILHSFGTYIPLQAPWNWIVVSVFLFAKAMVVGAHFAGLLSTQLGFTLGSGVLICSACAGGIATGLPLALMPAPLIGAAGLSLFYDSGMLRDYLLFVAGTASTAFWLLWHHFWFLEISVGIFTLQTICQLLAAALVIALVLPGLAFADPRDLLIKNGVQVFLLVQALAIVMLEEQLYGGEHDEDVVLYPAYLVTATSIAGIYLARTLEKREQLLAVVSWSLQCAYFAKLPMLILPEANLVFPTFLLAMATTAPFLFPKHPDERQDQLPAWKGALVASGVVIAVLLSRMAIFDLVHTISSSRPSEGVLLGALFLVMAAGNVPLVHRFYLQSSTAKRWIILCAAFGVLLCLLRPPVPITGMVKCPNLPAGLCPRLWDERHIPHHEVDDVEVYGLGLSRREHWPLWLLISAVMTGLTAITSSIPIQKSIQTRIFWGGLGGLSVGSYLALEFFPDQTLLQIIIMVSTLICCFLLVFVQCTSTAASAWMILLGTLWTVLLALALIIQAEITLPPLPDDMKRLFPDNPRLVTVGRERAGKASILAIYACQSLLLSFSLKLRISKVLREASVVGPSRPNMNRWDPQKHGFGGDLASASPPMQAFCGPGGLTAMFNAMVSPRTLDKWAGMMQMAGAGGHMLQRLSAEGLGWGPTAGNVMTMLCFLLSLWWSTYFSGNKDLVLFFAAPILLLLNQDPVFCRELVEKRRYVPVVFALVACWSWNACSAMIFDGLFPSPTMVQMEAPSWFVLKNLICLLCTFPSILMVLHYLWVQKRVTSHSFAFYILPLNVVAFVLPSLISVRLLAGLGFVGCTAVSIQNIRLTKSGSQWI